MAYTTFSYAGISFQQPFAVLDHREQVILDSARNYLYTRHVFRVRANYNGKTTSYGVPPGEGDAGPNQPAPKQAGNPPANTETNIRQQLEQSRQQLIYSIGGNVVLQSPLPTFSVDANNGPVAIVHDIWEVKGQKTFCVDFTVSTDVNEASKFVKVPPVVISNLWRMRNTVGDDSFTIRTITGNIVCRSDLLQSTQSVPHDFLNALYFPVPENFKRISIDVAASEDGNSCEYTIVDQEMPYNLIYRNGIVRVEAQFNHAYTFTGQDEIDWMKFQLNVNSVVGALSNVTSLIGGLASANIGKVTGATTGLIGTVGNHVMESGKIRRATAPRAVYSISAQMWGNASITGHDLTNSLIDFLQVRILAVIKQLVGSSVGLSICGFEIRRNWMARYVEGSTHFTTAPLKNLGNDTRNLLQGTANLYCLNYGVDFVNAQDVTSVPLANPLPLNRNGMAGSYLGAVVAAQLQQPNVPPVTPTGQGLTTGSDGGRTVGSKSLTGG